MIQLPNIKKAFIPDPGYTIYDADLAGADLQIVAWEADDESLKDAFRAGVDVHRMNKEDLQCSRKEAKAGVHATNYGCKPPRLAQVLGKTRKEAEDFQKRWFSIHPGIARWHRRIEMELQRTRTVCNRFGYRRTYFDRVEKLLPEALAWIPQSSVAIIIKKAMINIDRDLREVIILLQVHDSLVFQLREETLLPQVHERMLIPVPYDEPLIIPVSLASSTKSWGDCEERQWPSL